MASHCPLSLWERVGVRDVLAALALLFTPALALAHNGEVHVDEQAPKAQATAGGAVLVPKESQFLLGIRTAVAAPRRMETRVTVPGRVVPRTDRQAQVAAPVAGRVLAPPGGTLPLVGARVKKGQVLAVVQQSLNASETSELGTGRIAAEAQVAQAEATLQQAQRDLARVRSLEGVVAQKEIEQAQTALRVAEEEAARARRARALYGAGGTQGGGRLAQFPLVAPLDGVLAEARATVGEQVDPSRVLFTVLDPSVVWVQANVFPQDLARLEAAKEALVRVEGYPERHFPAALFHLGQVVDESTRTVRAIFELKNPEGRLRPGMFAEVAIGAGGAQEVLAVPDAAVVEVEGRKRVYVHTGPEQFVAREVALGQRDGAFLQVREGLKAGERVVTEGVYQVRSAAGGQ
jgi:membrane fusion protein, heavy metal efflux system